jgi:uncharacterized protein YcbX
MPSGTVLDLWRWPVKSMRGEQAEALNFAGGGVEGDRAHVVLRDHKGELKPLTAREAPRLLAWSAAYEDGEPLAVVTGPGGRRWRWDEPGLHAALEEDLGRAVRLDHDPAGFPDLPDSVLVTVEGTRRALEEELGEAVDRRRFRPNLHLDLDAEPWAELGWEGAELEVGEVRLRLLHPCVRCAIPTRDPETQRKWPQLLRHLDARHDRQFGVNARVIRAGRVALGDHVRVEGAVASGSGPIGR